MWDFKEGYDYIVVNFGGWHYAKTAIEAAALLIEWRKKDLDTQCYTNGFFSDKLGKWIGKGKWFSTAKS